MRGQGQVAFTTAMEGIAVKLKTYQAYTMAEALSAVKRDLGDDAVILNTRTFRRGGVLGVGRRRIVEVTATPARDDAATPRITPTASVALRVYGQTASEEQSDEPQPTPAAVLEADRARTRRLAQAMIEHHDRRQRAGQRFGRSGGDPA